MFIHTSLVSRGLMACAARHSHAGEQCGIHGRHPPRRVCGDGRPVSPSTSRRHQEVPQAPRCRSLNPKPPKPKKCQKLLDVGPQTLNPKHQKVPQAPLDVSPRFHKAPISAHVDHEGTFVLPPLPISLSYFGSPPPQGYLRRVEEGRVAKK